MLEDEHELQRVTIGQKFAIYTILRFDYFSPLKLNSQEQSGVVENAENTPKSRVVSSSTTSSLYKNKEKEKEQEGNNSEPTTSEKLESQERWKIDILNDDNLIAQLCDGLEQSKDEIIRGCKKFFAEILAKGKYYKSRQLLQEHLYNWLRRSIEKQKEASQNNEIVIDPRRGCPPQGELPKFKPDGTKRFFSKS